MIKSARFFMASAFALAVTALAQTGSSAATLPAAPSAASSAPVAATGSGNKIGVINIEQAIFASNEGQREFEALSKKLEPKQTELKTMSDELEGLKKQLNTQSDKLNEDARSALVRQVDAKQKVFDRSMQDARDDFQGQQNEIAQKILQKMAPVFTKYAADNGFSVILDTSNPWPQGPVIWRGDSVDITKAIVDAYNVQSGVAPPARPASSPRPATPTTRPATTTKPATETK
jgi:outer membrane protein